MRRVSRRDFLAASVAAGAMVRSLPAIGQTADPMFRHGVASGDPLSDRVMLWTRVTPKGTGPVDVNWVVTSDPKLGQVVASGRVRTHAGRDYTVKVDVPGLNPATTYYYRFDMPGARSAVGRTRTLPVGNTAHVRLGVVSCSNLPQGYFNAYACLAKRLDLDAVLHLGDYIYEYKNAEYGDGTKMGRIPMPDKEILTLADYRERHAQYKTDVDSQAVHAQHPFICVWDDHEFADNSYWTGANNHQPATEGDWAPRRTAAAKAYYEWMPIREDDQSLMPRIYRTFTFGNLVSLIMLDTRIVGRDEPARRDDVATANDVNRQMLGAAQEQWLAGELLSSVSARNTWNILGQQVMFAPQTPVTKGPANGDSWDGYRGCRDRVFDIIERTKADNIAVLTGDVHSSWAYDLPRDPFNGFDIKTGKGSRGVELAGTSISSPSNIGAGPDGEKNLAQMRADRPHLHYVDGRYRGYFIVDLTKDRLQADFFANKTVADRTTDERFVVGFVTGNGNNHLVSTSTPVK